MWYEITIEYPTPPDPVTVFARNEDDAIEAFFDEVRIGAVRVNVRPL